MKKYTVLKLIGLALLTMIVLMMISFIEVAIYSYLINPGQPQTFYDDHAMITAPYISGIFGFIVFYLIVRYWKKKGVHNVSKLALLLPLTYVLIDLIIMFAFKVDWNTYLPIFLISNGLKFLGAFLGDKLIKNNSLNPPLLK